MVSARSHKIPRVSCYSGSCQLHFGFAYASFTLCGWSFQYHSATKDPALCSPNPMVHAPWFGLAATCGIILIFSSSGYLDVSVHRVPSVWLWIYHTVTGCASRVPPFRHLRINAYVQLPAAFRSLSRLSSALSAKASALRPLLLNHCSWISLLIRLVLFIQHGDSYWMKVIFCLKDLSSRLACYLLNN